MMNNIYSRGMVLVTALIILLTLTVISISVMQWSREDLNIVGAMSSRGSAEQVVTGTLQEVMIINGLPSTLSTMGASASVTTRSSVVVPLLLRVESTCKRRMNASSDSVIKSCRYVDASSSASFAKSNTGSVQMTLDIEQPLLSNSGG